MVSPQQRHSTFLKAVGVYIAHSLQAALLLLEKVRSYDKIGGGVSDYYGRSTQGTLKKLVQYLQEATVAHLSAENVSRRLAILDRLEESVLWSRKWRFLNIDTESSFQAVNVILYSAQSLMFAEKHASKDAILSNEWLLVSQLCEASANCALKRHNELSSIETKDGGSGRIQVCKTIISLLDHYPELLPSYLQNVVARYKFKQSVAVKEVELECECQRAQSLCAEQTDPRLRRLLQHQRTVLTSAIAELRRMYEECEEGTQLYRTLLNHSKWHTALWTEVKGMQASFQTSYIEPAPANQPATAALGPQLQTLHADGEKLLDDVAAFLVNHSLQPSASFATDMSALQKRAALITASVKDLAKGISGNALAPHVRVKLREALAVRPMTKYHQKIVACLEKAVTVASPREADQYVQLAEGIFDCAVTCNAQWERAVESRDDKLADFWQRARERAWEVGCAVDGGNYSRTGPIPKVVQAVHLAQCAQTLQQQQPASPLHQAEVNISFQACELLLTDSADTAYRSKYNLLDRLSFATASVHHLLSGYNLTRSRGSMLAFAGVDTVVAPVHLEETLLWTAKTVGTLYNLCTRYLIDKDLDTPAAAERAASCLTSYCALFYKHDRVSDMRQFMIKVDLSVWSLQLQDEGDQPGSWALDTLANAYMSNELMRSFMNKVSNELRSFRAHLTTELEASLLGSRPELQRELTDRWPPSRRVWLSNVTDTVVLSSETAADVTTDATTDATTEIVQVALRGLRWQQTRCQETTLELQKLAEEVSTKAAEVVTLLQELEEAAWMRLSGSEIGENNVIKCRMQASKVQLRALELQYQAAQCGDSDVSAQCTEVCNFLLPITNRGLSLLTCRDQRNDWYDVRAGMNAVEALCKRGELRLNAIAATLSGNEGIAELWLAAAEACRRAVIENEDSDLDERLHYDWKRILLQAEGLAEHARATEAKAMVTDTVVADTVVADTDAAEAVAAEMEATEVVVAEAAV